MQDVDWFIWSLFRRNETPTVDLPDVHKTISVLAALPNITLLRIHFKTVHPAVRRVSACIVPSASDLQAFQPRYLQMIALSSDPEGDDYWMDGDGMNAWYMLEHLAKAASHRLETIAFESKIDLSDYDHLPDMKFQYVRRIEAIKTVGSTFASSTFGKLLAMCDKLTHFRYDSDWEERYEYISQAFGHVLSDPSTRLRLRELDIGGADLQPFWDEDETTYDLASISSTLPVLEILRLVFGPCKPSRTGHREQKRLSDTLEALFPPSDTCHRLKSIYLACQENFLQLFGSNRTLYWELPPKIARFHPVEILCRPSYVAFERFNNRTHYPALTSFRFRSSFGLDDRTMSAIEDDADRMHPDCYVASKATEVAVRAAYASTAVGPDSDPFANLPPMYDHFKGDFAAMVSSSPPGLQVEYELYLPRVDRVKGLKFLRQLHGQEMEVEFYPETPV